MGCKHPSYVARRHLTYLDPAARVITWACLHSLFRLLIGSERQKKKKSRYLDNGGSAGSSLSLFLGKKRVNRHPFEVNHEAIKKDKDTATHSEGRGGGA
jgi:hypothetical protein